jgi:hypothetical protein
MRNWTSGGTYVFTVTDPDCLALLNSPSGSLPVSTFSWLHAFCVYAAHSTMNIGKMVIATIYRRSSAVSLVGLVLLHLFCLPLRIVETSRMVGVINDALNGACSDTLSTLLYGGPPSPIRYLQSTRYRSIPTGLKSPLYIFTNEIEAQGRIASTPEVIYIIQIQLFAL